MAEPECEALHARAQMLDVEAHGGLIETLQRSASRNGFNALVEIDALFDNLADAVEAEIGPAERDLRLAR